MSSPPRKSSLRTQWKRCGKVSVPLSEDSLRNPREGKDTREILEGKVICEHSDLVGSVLFVVVMMVLVFRSTDELSKSAGYEGSTSD